VEQEATIAAVVTVTMGLMKLIEKLMQKANGGSLEYRFKALEKEIGELKEQVGNLTRGFYEFREVARIRWAREDMRDEREDEARH
tara:strand:+ start:10695 stop:10949 length:255 start_codon:yes stop_codon:yes gene_type:complete